MCIPPPACVTFACLSCSAAPVRQVRHLSFTFPRPLARQQKNESPLRSMFAKKALSGDDTAISEIRARSRSTRPGNGTHVARVCLALPRRPARARRAPSHVVCVLALASEATRPSPPPRNVSLSPPGQGGPRSGTLRVVASLECPARSATTNTRRRCGRLLT